MFNQEKFIDSLCCYLGNQNMTAEALKIFIKANNYVIYPTKEIIDYLAFAKDASVDSNLAPEIRVQTARTYAEQALKLLELENTNTRDIAKLNINLSGIANGQARFSIKGKKATHKVEMTQKTSPAGDPRDHFEMKVQSMDEKGLLVTEYSGLESNLAPYSPSNQDPKQFEGVTSSLGYVKTEYYNPTSLELCGFIHDESGYMIPPISDVISPDEEETKSIEVSTLDMSPKNQLEFVLNNHTFNMSKYLGGTTPTTTR